MSYRYLFAGLVLMVAGLVSFRFSLAQEVVTSTPARVVIPTQAPPQMQQSGATATWTRTPTVSGPALLEAKPEAGDVNVRADADINSERLGSIRSGDTYVVLGRLYRWYQFQFDTSPTGVGWVFDELVNIIGDESVIRNLEFEALPTTDPVIAAQTETQAAVTQTPGGLLTSTAEARILPAPDAQGSTMMEGLDEMVIVLPTFTYPPDSMLFARTEEPNTEGVPVITANPSTIPLPEDIPPIAPILVLGGLGVLGLAVSSLRR